MIKKALNVILSFVFIFSMLPPNNDANARGKTEKEDSVDLWEAVRPLTTTASFLNTGAHPDDERSHLDAYLSRGKGVQTGLSLATRGKAGQNEIGDELGNGLAIIRTHELEKSSALLGVNLFILNHGFNDSIYDFGFSKSPEETLKKWGGEEAYKRLIKVIRTFKPDIVMPSFRDVDTQHGHHRAVTELTLKAFKGAADPDVFPEQLKDGLTTWQIKKLYLPSESDKTTTTQIQIGIKDPIYDMTYPQLGEKARYFHKSQGMGRDVGDGPETVNLQLVKSAVGAIPNHESGIFDSLPYNFSDYAKQLKKGGHAFKGKLNHLQKELNSILKAYPNDGKVFDLSHQTLKDVRKMKRQLAHFKPMAKETRETLLHKLDVKERQLEKASFVASRLKVNINVKDPKLTKGDATKVEITYANNGEKTIKKIKTNLLIPKEWRIEGKQKSLTLKPGEETKRVYTVKVPKNGKLYDFFAKPSIQVEINYQHKHVTSAYTLTPKKRVAVLPKVSVKADPENLVINTSEVKDSVNVKVNVHKYAEGKMRTKLSLKLPSSDWKLDHPDQTITFAKDETDKTAQFTIHPPKNIEKGKFNIKAIAKIDGIKLNTTVQNITYPHIGTDYYLYPATVEGAAFPLSYPKDLKVGYIDSGFDKVADALSDIGINITKLTEENLKSGDLSKYDTIVTGVRSYLSRDDLLKYNGRLLDYVKNGGHLVVQYNKPGDNWNPDTSAPYRLVIGHPSIEWRVTDEHAKVNILRPKSPLFNKPNQITGEDWSGWVQERGLYFPMEWDDHFKTYLSMADPGEDAFNSGILMADYGKGTYLYTNLVWYREIQNQVPGGYRIFTNLISYPLTK
ncbi:LmbE family N-acetylglucosaminyl deacetylase [Scopulibacillus darangshiensis]|uniref:LmbE family N-acetylglucosaminyl deacetylase n=1 Tax=Scopulibacillus darangshiensis TaxID=442528 RepID=A0A4R2P8M5_9BACL|nr:PIG-L family deacetylase [Scopulibacillus darangshiensis]TCP31323.1 LmbE family N-acetylglucosaminyl deacetylase [Scopulibacillus darangshiensis]